ncbi:hypothetical protein KC320_g92 [Hortaea werneckii]|nr:hypothetical protein KC320_g92 [Hortaea werneckii]
MVWEQTELVVGDHISGDGLSIIRSEQLRRCMPQLPVFAVFLFVQLILKLGISLPQHAVELRLVWYSVELERLTWVEDGHVLAEIAIMGIVQAVLNEVPHEHLHPPRPFSPPAGKWSVRCCQLLSLVVLGFLSGARGLLLRKRRLMAGESIGTQD